MLESFEFWAARSHGAVGEAQAQSTYPQKTAGLAPGAPSQKRNIPIPSASAAQAVRGIPKPVLPDRPSVSVTSPFLSPISRRYGPGGAVGQLFFL